MFDISEETCQRKRRKPLSRPVRTKRLERKKQKRTLKERRKMESAINHAVLPEERIGRGTDIAQRAGTGTHGKRQMLIRKLAVEAKVKTRGEKKMTSAAKLMTNEGGPAAETGKRRTPKNERRRGNEKTEARKKPNNILKEVKRRKRKRPKRRKTASSIVTDRKAKKRLAMRLGDPGLGGGVNAGSLATEGVTDVAAAVGTGGHRVGHGAEIGLGTAGEMPKIETRGRALPSQRAKRTEAETGAPKNVPLRNNRAETETIDRAVTGREGRRATVEAAILIVMKINETNKNGARAQNRKTERRTNLKAREKM